MSNKTPVVPSTEGPPTHGHKDELAAEELASPGSTATCFPNITETREVVNMNSSESEEMKNSGEGPPTHGHRDELTAEELANSESITTRNPSPAALRGLARWQQSTPSEDKNILGGGVRAMRRHRGTVVMACCVKRRDSKKMGVLLAAAGIFVPDMTHLKRCGFFGGVVSKRERLSRAKKKDSVYPIGDGNKTKKPGARTQKGARNGTRTHVGMSKRLDLHIRTGKHEPSSCACDRGDISLINTRI